MCRTIDNTSVLVLKMLVICIEAHVYLYMKGQTRVSMVPEKNTVRMRVSAHCADAFLNVSQVFIAQGCGDSDPCGDSGHCAVFELKHLEPSLFPHPCAETPTCVILVETKALGWG